VDIVFADTDVCLDLLAERHPFYNGAARLFSLADQKTIVVAVSSLSFSHIHYLLRKEFSSSEARKILSRFKALVRVLSVDDRIIQLALQSSFKDFEDGIQYFTAEHNKASLIVTRNLKDFKESVLPVMTPDSYLKMSDR
jgi:predicted nucleic acid-binding protein